MSAPATDHRRNVLLLGSVEVGWGVAMAFVQPESVLPALLARLGASDTVLGILPAIYYASFPFEVWSPYATEALPRKRLLVWGLHNLIPLVWAALGLWLLLGNVPPGNRSIALFYLGFLAHSASIAFLIPLWYDFMGKITDPRRRGSAFSTIFALQSIAGCAGAFLGEKLLASPALHAGAPFEVPRYGVCYLVAAVMALAGNQAFLFTRESAGAPAPPRPPLASYFRGLGKILREDGLFRRYVLARGVTRLAPIVATYYSVEAVRHFGKATPVALFTLALIAGKLVSSLVSWRFSDVIGMKPFIVAGTLALALAGAIAAACEWAPQPALGVGPYYAIAFLVGVFQLGDGSGHATFIMNLAPETKRATYYTTVNGTLFPLTAGAPILAGAIADRVGLAPVQAVATALFLGAAAFLALAIPEERPSAAPVS